MERELYREHLCRLREIFPDTDVITVSDAADYLHVDRRTILTADDSPAIHLKGRYLIPLINLARWLSCR